MRMACGMLAAQIAMVRAATLCSVASPLGLAHPRRHTAPVATEPPLASTRTERGKLRHCGDRGRNNTGTRQKRRLAKTHGSTMVQWEIKKQHRDHKQEQDTETLKQSGGSPTIG